MARRGQKDIYAKTGWKISFAAIVLTEKKKKYKPRNKQNKKSHTHQNGKPTKNPKPKVCPSPPKQTKKLSTKPSPTEG